MFGQFYRLLGFCACLLLYSVPANAYDYPFTDPYVATVVNTLIGFFQAAKN